MGIKQTCGHHATEWLRFAGARMPPVPSPPVPSPAVVFGYRSIDMFFSAAHRIVGCCCAGTDEGLAMVL